MLSDDNKGFFLGILALIFGVIILLPLLIYLALELWEIYAVNVMGDPCQFPFAIDMGQWESEIHEHFMQFYVTTEDGGREICKVIPSGFRG